jgi:hypothetical protein
MDVWDPTTLFDPNLLQRESSTSDCKHPSFSRARGIELNHPDRPAYTDRL